MPLSYVLVDARTDSEGGLPPGLQHSQQITGGMPPLLPDCCSSPAPACRSEEQAGAVQDMSCNTAVLLAAAAAPHNQSWRSWRWWLEAMPNRCRIALQMQHMQASEVLQFLRVALQLMPMTPAHR